MADNIDWSCIARYLAGDCSEDERRMVEARVAGDPALREAVDAAQRIWASTEPEPEPDQWNTSAAWQTLTRKEAAARSSTPVRLLRVKSPHGAGALPWQGRRQWRTAGRWAVAVAVAAAFAAAVWFRADTGPRAGATAEVAGMYTISTKPGQRLDLRMPDGTRVVLGVASTLRYPRTYGAAGRQLYLDGQAYFEVTHDAARPFTVYAGNAVARDLGTRFDVRAYAEDDGVEVVVAEGKVELTGKPRIPAGSVDSRPAVLLPGQLGRVDGSGVVATRDHVPLDQHLAWVDGRLVFKDVSLRDMLPELSRWYDLELQLADPSLGDRRLTGTFQDESVPAALQFLALSLDVSYEQRGRTIVLIPNHGAR